MQAVIRSGSKQYVVKPGQTLEIDLVAADTKTLELPALLVIDGANVTVGTPEVAGVAVRAEVVGEVAGEKLKVLKFQAKKRVYKQTGHRQHYTQIKITSIGKAGGKAAGKASEKAGVATATAKPKTAAAK